MSCSPGEQAHILEAFLTYQKDHSFCNEHCEPAPGSSALCRFIHAKCQQRLRFEDLNKVYSKCDADPSYCDVGNIDKNELTVKSPFQLEYTCLSEKATINPCVSSSRTTTNASLLLPLQQADCRALCEITVTPSNAPAHITFTYNFLRNSNFGHASIKYRFIHVNSSGKPPTWKTLDGSSYYQDGPIIQNVEKIVISFDVPQPKSVTRLWVYFSGAEVSITCHNTAPGITSSQTEVSTHVALTSRSPTTSQESATDGKINTNEAGANLSTTHPVVRDKGSDDVADVSMDATHFLTIGLVAGVLGASVVFAGVVVCILRTKRRNRQTENERPPSERASKPAHFPVDDQIYHPYAEIDDLHDLPREAMRNTGPPPVHFPVDDQIYHPYAEIDDRREPAVDADGYLCPLAISQQLPAPDCSKQNHS
ncbi:hypothetical protein BaRGS_00020979 [Batillaria attramentaria]|uniref:Uncharacterized protein n=1 Tax=Batillaria attramentaria TaxID=370345 RepID=A0ABD0KKT2_9CAEN